MSLKSNLSSAVYWYIQCTRYLHLINNWNWVARINSSKNVVNRGHWNTTLATVSTTPHLAANQYTYTPPPHSPTPTHAIISTLTPSVLESGSLSGVPVSFILLKRGYIEGLLFSHYHYPVLILTQNAKWFWTLKKQHKCAETETPVKSGPGLLAWPWRHLNPGTL